MAVVVNRAHLRDHWHQGFALASCKTDDHPARELPFVALRIGTENSTHDHNDGGDEKDDSTTNTNGNGHANNVSNAPAATVSTRITRNRMRVRAYIVSEG